MTRPPSRSEKLLRDTLRKAEEQERLAQLAALPSPPLLGGMPPYTQVHTLAPGFVLNTKSSGAARPPRRHVRRNTSSSSGTDASMGSIDYFKGQLADGGVVAHDEDHDMDGDSDEQEWLWRTQSATSVSSLSSAQHGYSYTSRLGAAVSRRDSTDKVPTSYSRTRAHTDPTGGEKLAPAAEIGFGSPDSPSLIPAARAALQRSSKSAPNVPRPGHSSRPSVEFETGSGGGLQLTPHEAVLRSRLEGVLRGAKEQEKRARSRETNRERERSSGSGSGNSMASSRNLSGEGEWFFGGGYEVSFS